MTSIRSRYRINPITTAISLIPLIAATHSLDGQQSNILIQQLSSSQPKLKGRKTNSKEGQGNGEEVRTELPNGADEADNNNETALGESLQGESETRPQENVCRERTNSSNPVIQRHEHVQDFLDSLENKALAVTTFDKDAEPEGCTFRRAPSDNLESTTDSTSASRFCQAMDNLFDSLTIGKLELRDFDSSNGIDFSHLSNVDLDEKFKEMVNRLKVYFSHLDDQRVHLYNLFYQPRKADKKIERQYECLHRHTMVHMDKLCGIFTSNGHFAQEVEAFANCNRKVKLNTMKHLRKTVIQNIVEVLSKPHIDEYHIMKAVQPPHEKREAVEKLLSAFYASMSLATRMITKHRHRALTSWKEEKVSYVKIRETLMSGILCLRKFVDEHRSSLTDSNPAIYEKALRILNTARQTFNDVREHGYIIVGLRQPCTDHARFADVRKVHWERLCDFMKSHSEMEGTIDNYERFLADIVGRRKSLPTPQGFSAVLMEYLQNCVVDMGNLLKSIEENFANEKGKRQIFYHYVTLTKNLFEFMQSRKIDTQYLLYDLTLNIVNKDE